MRHWGDIGATLGRHWDAGAATARERLRGGLIGRPRSSRARQRRRSCVVRLIVRQVSKAGGVTSFDGMTNDE